LKRERELILEKNCPLILIHEKEEEKKRELKKNAKTHEEIEHCSFKPKINKFNKDVK